jgi:hypothetical protein
MCSDMFRNRSPAPTEWHGETLLMRDEFGDPAGTALFPLHLGFRAMVEDEEVILRKGDFHAFVDRLGLLQREMTKGFQNLREEALQQFVIHLSAYVPAEEVT